MDDSAPIAIDARTPELRSPSRSLMMQCVDALCTVRYKSLAFLFVMFILITSDVFVGVVLKKLNGAVDEFGIATPFGVTVQGLVLVLAYILLEAMIKRELI